MEFRSDDRCTRHRYACIFAQACLVGPLVRWIGRTHRPLWEGLVIGGALVGCSLLQALGHHTAFYIGMRGGWNARCGCITLLHAKLLRTSTAEVRRLGTGYVFSLASTDALRFDGVTTFLWTPPSAAVMLVAVFALLAMEVGFLAAGVGCGVVVLAIGLQLDLGARFKRLRRQASRRTDRRVRLVAELLKGVLAIKASRWEAPFGGVVASLRRDEARSIERAQRLKGVNSAFYFSTTSLAAFATFTIFVLVEDGELTVPTASTGGAGIRAAALRGVVPVGGAGRGDAARGYSEGRSRHGSTPLVPPQVDGRRRPLGPPPRRRQAPRALHVPRARGGRRRRSHGGVPEVPRGPHGRRRPPARPRR